MLEGGGVMRWVKVWGDKGVIMGMIRGWKSDTEVIRGLKSDYGDD